MSVGAVRLGTRAVITMLDLVALSLRASTSTTANCEAYLVKGSCAYYHYMCDELDDRVSLVVEDY